MNKKKWRGNSKIFSTIIVLFVACCLMATSSWAARKVDFYSANSGSFIEKLNQNESTESESIGPLLGLSQDEAFTLLHQKTDFNGVTHYRYQQTYKGIPVWGVQTIVSRIPSKKVVRLHGAMVLDIPRDIKNIPSSLDPRGALKKMEDQHKKIEENAQWTFRNEEYGTYIYLHKDKKAYLCYVVSFFADTEKGNPSQYIHFIDVTKDKVLHSFDMLKYAMGVGPGGNQKTGCYYYGIDYPGFCVTQEGSTCTMDCPKVKTVDLNHGTSGSTPYFYTCYENTHEEINGACCPLNDAQYFGYVVFNMYDDWFYVDPLPFQLTIRCHYSTNYENAFWDGSTITFGDGYNTFYPLVCLDIIGHEVSHGFTECNSDLIYAGQSGGINESFSDMAGEGAKYFMRDTNDFMVGFDIFKNPTGALRYMYDPPLDGISIDHVDDYYEGMDVHYSSGIFNKAFYLIATSSGWNTRMAFTIFVKANQDYWTPSTNFQQGAEGALDAALDYGYPCADVRNAFAEVGITLNCPGPPVADFSAYPTSGGVPLTTQFTDLSQNNPTSWSWDFGDGGTSTEQDPIYTYDTIGIYTVTLTAANQYGPDTMMKTNYITVTTPQPPIADFTASATNIYIGDSVTFTDISLENPTSWDWTFEGGTPDNSTDQDPTGIEYYTEGTYTVTLIATNAQGNDTETKVDYITVSERPYCTSSGNNQSYEYIAGVAVVALNNSSEASPYTDFTGLVTHLTQGNSSYVSLTPGFTGSSYTEYWKIWIDYNGNHVFEVPGEEAFAGFGSSVVTGCFTPPTDTIIGKTRMRVSMKYGSYPTPCETFTYGEVEDYTVCITCPTDTCNFGYSGDPFTEISTSDYRRAMPFTMPEDGTIKSVTMYHEAGSGSPSDQMILGVYAGEGSPQDRLAVTSIDPATNVSTSAGWQTIELESYPIVSGGSTVWLAWVYENNPGIRYQSGLPGRFQSPKTWLDGMPDPFGEGTHGDKKYNIYYTYDKEGHIVGTRDEFTEITTSDVRRAQPFTMPEDGTIVSVTMYHENGSGNKMILAVYDGEVSPQNRIAITEETLVSAAGWQTIELVNPVPVTCGSQFFLAWVYEETTETTSGIRYQIGSPGAFDSDSGWPNPKPPTFDPMPEQFGPSSQTNYRYSIYATYTTVD